MDTGLEWHSLRTDGTRVSGGDLVIIETKSGATPSVVDHLLWEQGVRPVKISKYGTAMAAMHDLPANKWHRVMHRELAQAGARPPTSVPAVGLLELVGARRRAEAPGRPPGALTRPRFSRGHSTCMRTAPDAPTDSFHPHPA